MKLPTPNIHEESFAYYTESQMRQAIRDALEVAAKVCDAHDYYGDPMAIEIRALKEQVE
jgi:hypothetical protein